MTDIRNPEPVLGTDANRPDKIAVLMEEYRAMYALVLYRLGALDQRTPIVAAVITGALASVASLPPHLQMAFLVGLPASILWFVRTTTNHARSLEDALRRIEQIESRANDQMHEQLLQFQSSHPSRGQEVGGRTGRESVETVVVMALLLLAGAVFVAWYLEDMSTLVFNAFVAYLVVIAGLILPNYQSLRRYRYRNRATGKVLVGSKDSQLR
jgi:membrane protein implicated in regulation of membrane protease activity